MLLEDLFSCLPPDRLEYHRNAAALVPDKNDPDPGVSVLTIDVKTGIPRLQCNCGASGKKRKCPHVALFSECVRQGGEIPKDNWLDAGFRKSPWYLLAAALHGACPVEPERLVVEFTETEAENIREIQILRPDNELLVFCRLNPTSNPDTGTDETDLLLERT
ncbi:MAG: hypothetical protein K9J79_06495, partial [Desulfobacteraceae bacterium]|nr:hypothetical protein [Desulfobacteraceae bacterium]